MENPYLIPVVVTLVTAMAIGAIYLLMLLANDGKSEPDSEDLLGEEGDEHAAAAEAHADAAPDAQAAGDAKH